MLALPAADLATIAEYRRGWPTPRLTLLFCDLLPDRGVPVPERDPQYHEALVEKLRAEHSRLVRDAVERDGAGCLVVDLGGSSMAVFRKAATAVERALQLQREVARHNIGRPE